MYFKFILSVFLILHFIAFLPQDVLAAKTKHQQPLNKAERIEKIESYLNSIRTFKAKFTQSDQDNNIRNGLFFLVRPNKMRFDYLNPQQESIVLDEDFLIHFNKELNEINYISASSFPISFLSKDIIDLRTDAKVLDVTDLNNTMSIELLISNNDNEMPRRIIIELNKKPMSLTGFYLQDDSGQTIRVKLTDIEINQSIDDSTFEVK